jgi:hypothetical protein
MAAFSDRQRLHLIAPKRSRGETMNGRGRKDETTSAEVSGKQNSVGVRSVENLRHGETQV